MLKFTFVVLLCFVFTLSNVNAQSTQLSNKAEISLLTCSSGDELYSIFGHSAISVCDDSLGVDLVFNYGTFNFRTPNFYLKFMNGDLNYMLSATTYDRFTASYKRENRSVVKHSLRLSDKEKQELWERLVTNIQPENREYRYDFFFDNCATRIRDIVFDVKRIDKNLFDSQTDKSFRNYLHIYIDQTEWTAQGIDCLLGAKTDYIASEYDRAFLPNYLDSLFFKANLIESSSISVSKANLYEEEVFTIKPLAVALILLVISLAVSVFEYRKNVYIKLFDITLFSFVLLLSILFWYMWLFTKHGVTSLNINTLWASILYLPLLILMFGKRNRKLPIKIITSLNCVALIVLILLSILGIQNTPSLAYPLSLALLIRNALIYSKQR